MVSKTKDKDGGDGDGDGVLGFRCDRAQFFFLWL